MSKCKAQSHAAHALTLAHGSGARVQTRAQRCAGKQKCQNKNNSGCQKIEVFPLFVMRRVSVLEGKIAGAARKHKLLRSNRATLST